MNHIRLIMGLFWALPSLLWCFPDITQHIIGISGFKIILCTSVTEAVLINSQQYVNNCLSSGVYQAAAWGNFLVQNPKGHSWEVLIFFFLPQAPVCMGVGDRHFQNHV